LRWYLIALAVWIGGQPGTSIAAEFPQSQVTAGTAVRGAPLVRLREGHAFQVEYAGDSRAVSALKSGTVRALSLTTADFDRNGTADVAIGYADGDGGLITLLRGNPEAFAPEDDSVFMRMQQGYDPDSLLPTATSFTVPEAPDFLFAGTFGDGQTGVLFARQGGGLYWLPGDAKGGFGAAREIALPGPVTALAAGEFRAADGYTDVAVGVATASGGALLIFDDAIDGFVEAVLELPLSAPLVAIEFGGLDDDAFLDVAAASDHELLIVHGWSRGQREKAETRVERVAVGPGVIGLAIGEFVWDRAGRKEIATLSGDGSVQIVRGADLDQQPFTTAELATRTRGTWLTKPDVVPDLEATPSWLAKRAIGWIASNAFKAGSHGDAITTATRPLLRSNLSYRESDDLMIVSDRGLEVVHEVARGYRLDVTASFGALKRTSLPVDGNFTAVIALPKKVNGVRDFVVLDAKRTEPIIVPQAPNTTITVDRTDDPSGAGLTAASACTAAANDCSLRGAFQFANNGANNNTTISLPANTYVLSINGSSAGGCDGNTVGDLGANQTMSLVGAGAATTIIRQTGTGPSNDGDRVMCMNEPFTVGLIYNFSGVTFVGGRDGTAAGTGTALGGGGIIGGELDNALTLTNVVFANNQVTVLGSANIGGGGIQITGGSLTITNSTFGGSSGPGLYTDRSSTTSANLQAGSGGGVMFTPSAPTHAGGTGNLTVTGSTFTRNTAGSVCCGGAGLDLVIFAFASPGGIGTGTATVGTSTFSNNQATGGNGGAIVVESLPTTVTTSSFTTNSALNRGGAIYVGGGSLHLNGTAASITFTGNTAPNGGTSISTAAPVSVTGTNTSIGGSIEVTTGGSWTMNAGSALAPTDVVIAGGTFNTNNSTVNINGNLSIGPAPIVGSTFNGNSGTINLAGNLTYTPGGSGPATSFNAGTGTFNFNGSGAQSVSNGASITFNHLTASNSAQPLTLNNSLAVNGNLTIGSNAVLAPVPAAVVSGTGTLTGSGRARVTRTAATPDFLSQYSITNKTLTNLTVDYNGAGAQTINNAPAYSHLVVSGSGTKTLQGNTAISGNLATVAGATFASGNFSFSLGGNWTNGGAFSPGTGTVTFGGSSGTQLLSGNTTFFNLTLNNTGATTSFGTTTTTIQNDLVASAGTMDGGTSTVNFTGVGDNLGAIGGAAAKNFHNLQVSAPATISNTAGGNLDIEGNYSNAGTFVQGAGLTTRFALDNNADGTHTFSGVGTTTFGNVTIDGSNTVDAGSHSFNVVGTSFAVFGTLAGNTSTARFNGAAAQTITGSGTKNFGALLIDNASGVLVADVTPGVDASVAGLLTLASDLTVAPGAVLHQAGTSAGTADVIGTVRRTDLGVTSRSFGNFDNQIAVDSGTPPTAMDFTLVKSIPPTFPAAVKVVPRTYTLTPTGGSGLSATMRLRYIDPGELIGAGITESSLSLWKRNATWAAQGGSVNTAGNFVTLSGISSFSEWAVAEVSDLTLSKSNNVGDVAVVGQPWTWAVTASNAGSPATFAAGQTILSDDLPSTGLNYGAVTTQNVSNITGSANISCSIVSSTLTCNATGGNVTFDSNLGVSSFQAVFSATPLAAGAQQNPRSGGSALVDPANAVVESNESNNTAAANTVTVGMASTTTTISSHLPDPSVAGFPVTVQWSVTVQSPGALGSALTGNVTVSDGSDSCIAAVSAGQCEVTFGSGGVKNMTATYTGDSNYNGSTSEIVTHTVNIDQPTIAKDFSPSSIVSGETSAITLTLSNSNGIALANASFSDTLVGMNAVGGAVTGTCAGTSPNMLVAGSTALAFSGITLPGQGSCTVTFSVTSTTPGVLPNTTTGVTTTQTPSAGTTSNTATLTVTPSADLAITKTDGTTTVTPGNLVTYTIVASNAGPNDVTGATVTDTFPASLSACNWTCVGAGGGTCTSAGSGHIADSSDLPVGGSVAYEATCTLSTAAVAALSNTASVSVPFGVSDPVLANNSATDIDTFPPRELTLSKSNDVGDSAVVGQPWTWTLTASNTGSPATFAAGQTILSDNLPTSNVGYSTVSVQNVSNITGSSNISCAIVSSDLTCTATGGSVTFDSHLGASHFDVALVATSLVGGVQQNPRAGGAAMIDPDDLVAEGNENDNAAAANTVTVGVASTTTTISSHLPDPSVAGFPVTVQWSVTVQNPGALGVALTGDITVSDGTDSCVAAVSAGQCAVTFASGGAKSLTATYTGDSNYSGSTSEIVTHTVNVDQPTIAKYFLPTSIVSGGTSAITLTLSNSNGIALTNASFSDTLAGMSAVDGPVTGTCVGTVPNTLVAGTTSLAFSGIALPGQGSCTVVFSVTSDTLGVHPNTTSGVTTTETPSAGMVSNTANLTVSPSADLSITKTDGSTTATQGSPVTYTIVASNGGPSDVSGAEVNDTFPGTLSGCGWSCMETPGANCTATGFGHIVDTVDLPNGSSVTFTATCTVAASATGTLSNTATVAAPGGTIDPNLGNNSATDDSTLPPLPDLTITKSHVGAFSQGDVGRIYTIIVTNSGGVATNGSTITVTDVVPEGLTPTAATGDGWSCNVASQTMTCTRAGALNPATEAPAIELTVNVAEDAASLIINTASVSGGGNVPSDNDSADDPTVVGGLFIFGDGFEDP
jgi:uncharacterized repeat protein (TIGR01451 family)